MCKSSEAWENKSGRLEHRAGGLDPSSVQSFHVKDKVSTLSQERLHNYA